MIKRILLATMLVANTGISQDTLQLKKDLVLLNGSFVKQPKLIEILEMNLEFEGYLVIELKKNEMIQTDSIGYDCSVFWVSSLENLNDKNLIFNYFTLFTFVFKNKLYNTEESRKGREITNFLKFYLSFNEANKKYFSTYLYDSLITTNLLDKSTIWRYQNRYLIIFETKFNTSVIKMKKAEWMNHKYIFNDWKIFIPISKLKYFRQFEGSDSSTFGFEKHGVIEIK